jgi:hypothetical protein
MKYYTIRILAALLFMGSIGVGFITGAEYGKLAGWLTFIVLGAIGIFLHILADKIQKPIEP